MGADPRVVGKETRLLELAYHLPELRRRERLLERIAPWRKIALRQLRGADHGLSGQIEHHVEALAPCTVRALEIDRVDRSAGLHALAVRLALVCVDLIREIDGVLRANTDAGIAARADLEIDGIELLPRDFERTEVTLDRGHPAREHRIAALVGQLAVLPSGDQHAHLELLGELVGPRDRCPRRADDQELPSRLVIHAGHRFGLGKIRESEQRRDLGRGLRALLRPAGVLPDVDEFQPRRRLRAFGKLGEKRRFLGARDHACLALERFLETADFLAAQLGVHLDRLLELERVGERLGVERHGLVAVRSSRAISGLFFRRCRWRFRLRFGLYRNLRLSLFGDTALLFLLLFLFVEE